MTLMTTVAILLLIIALMVWGSNCGNTTAEIAFPLTILIIAGIVLWFR